MKNESGEEALENTEEPEGRPSWPYPTFLFLYVVILILTPMVGTTVGLILFFGLLSFCFWGAISRKQYELLRKRYASLSRKDYVINNLIFPVIVPIIIFVVLMVFMQPS